jgi:3-polyprenyl-4-hydroxybenzoate decarboxylase
VSRTAVVAVIAAASLSVFATVVMPASADQIHGVEVGYTVLLKERT